MYLSKDYFYVFLLLLTLLPACLYGQPKQNGQVSYSPRVDSLLNLIKISNGPELLKQYPRLHKALYEVNDLDIHLKYNAEFAERARAAKDKKMQAIAAVLKIEALYNYRVSDSILLAESFKALEVMKDVPGAEVHYFYTASVIGDVYMLQGDYEKALEAAEKFYAQAKKTNSSSGIVASLQSMGKAYEELGMPDKAEASFRESITAADERTDSGIKGESYSFLIDMLNAQKRYKDALEVNNEFAAYLKRIDAYNGELKNLCFLNELGYAASYTGLKAYKPAWEHIAKAEQFPVAKTSMGMYSVENERSRLLIEEGRYAEAEESLNDIEHILGDDAAYYKAAFKLKETQADLYFRWGKYDKAAYAYKAYITGQDSLQRVEMATKLHALRTQYEVDKLEMQQEQQRQTFRSTMFWFSMVLLLLCIVISVIVVNARRLSSKNRSLLDRIQELDKLEENNERIRGELAKKKTPTLPENEKIDKSVELYMQLNELMKDPTVFTNPCINRKVIAERLRTNEKYIFEIVHEYYNMNVSDYITTLRLNHARSLLATSSGSTIESIAIDAGFSSRTTFHRLFKEHYGMTPVEFRKLMAGS